MTKAAFPGIVLDEVRAEFLAMSRELNIVVDLSDWRAPKLSPWARRFLVAGALFALLAPEAGSQLEDVQLNTYFPAPSGIYQQLMTSGNAYFATTGGATEIGGASSAIGNASLVVARGNVGIGTAASGINAPSYYFNQPGGGGGLRIGPYVSGGQAQIQLDNSQSNQAGQLNRWTDRLQLWATDEVALGSNAGSPYSDTLSYQPGSLTVAGPTNVAIQGEGMSSTAQIVGTNSNAGLWYTSNAPGNVPYNCYWTGSSNCQACPSGQNVVLGGGGGCDPSWTAMAAEAYSIGWNSFNVNCWGSGSYSYVFCCCE